MNRPDLVATSRGVYQSIFGLPLESQCPSLHLVLFIRCVYPYSKSWQGLEQPLGLQVEGELPLLAKALAADLDSEPAHSGTAAVQAEVTADMAELRVGLNLLPFLLTNKSQY